MGLRHQTSRIGRRWFIGSALVVLFAACADRPPIVAIGFASNMGAPNVADVAQAALDDAHRPGKPRIRVTTEDSALRSSRGGLGSEVDRALAFAKNPSVVAVVGPGGSREALQTAPVYREAGLANVIPTGTSGRLRFLGPLSFLLAPSDSTQGEFIGAFIADELHARTAAIMYLPDEYGVGLAAGSAAALSRRGVSVLARLPVRPAQSCPPSAPRNSYDDVVADVFMYGVPDVIVLAARTVESACIARAARERSAATRFVAGDGTLVNARFVPLAGAAADSIYFVAFWNADRADAVTRDFVQRFRDRLKREPRHDEAMFYDAVMVVSQAVREGGPTRADVAKYLSELGRERPPYVGVTGPIAFTPGAPRPLIITRLRDGRLQRVPFRR